MKKSIFRIVWTALILALMVNIIPVFSFPAFALDTNNSTYVLTIRVSNNGTVDAYNVTVPITINTSAFVNNDYVWSNLTNSAMITNQGMNAYYNPAVVTNTTWMFLVPYIPASSSIDYSLYMGGDTAMGGNLSYFPGAAGMVTADNASMEFGSSNISFSSTHYIDMSNTTVGHNIVNKAGAFVINVTSDGNLTLFTGGRRIQAYNGTYVAVGNTTTIAGQNFSVFPNSIISDVKFLLKKVGTPTGTAYCRIRKISDNSIIGTVGSIDISTIDSSNFTWYTFNTTAVAVTEQNARITYENDSCIGAFNYTAVSQCPSSIYSGENFEKYFLGAYVNDIDKDLGYMITTDFSKIITAPTTSGYNWLFVNIVYDWTVVLMLTNGGYKTPEFYNYGTHVVDNANDWYFYQNNTCPIVYRHGLSTQGYQTNQIQWQNSAIFYDSSSTGNHATPSFRTTTSNANVSALLLSMKAVNQAIASNWTLESYTTNAVGTMPGTPPEMFDEMNPTFPGHSIPDEIAAEADVPVSLFWFLIPIIIILILGMIIHNVTKSLMAQAAVIAICVLLVSLMHIWPLWMLVPYCMMAGAAVLAGKVYSY